MSIPMKELPPELRPYEKAIAYGVSALDNAELLAILLRNGLPGENSLELSHRLLAKWNGNLADGSRCSLKELCAIPGIGKVKGLQILSAFELATRIPKSERITRPDFSDPSYIVAYFMEEMRQKVREVLKVLFLDTKCRFITEKDMSIGSVNQTAVPVREIFMEAFNVNAVHLILLHNHPSGDPTPSREDIQSTREVKDAGKLIGITLEDHIIFGDHRYVSLREQGYLKW